MTGPNPNAVYPNEAIKSVVFIKNVVTNPNIIIEITLITTISTVRNGLKSM